MSLSADHFLPQHRQIHPREIPSGIPDAVQRLLDGRPDNAAFAPEVLLHDPFPVHLQGRQERCHRDPGAVLAGSAVEQDREALHFLGEAAHHVVQPAPQRGVGGAVILLFVGNGELPIIRAEPLFHRIRPLAQVDDRSGGTDLRGLFRGIQLSAAQNPPQGKQVTAREQIDALADVAEVYAALRIIQPHGDAADSFSGRTTGAARNFRPAFMNVKMKNWIIPALRAVGFRGELTAAISRFPALHAVLPGKVGHCIQARGFGPAR
jgi:hypothetical protein